MLCQKRVEVLAEYWAGCLFSPGIFQAYSLCVYKVRTKEVGNFFLNHLIVSSVWQEYTLPKSPWQINMEKSKEKRNF